MSRGAREGILQHVPEMELAFDGDCAQANGLELPVVVINLPHRTDRWETVSRRLAASGFSKLLRAPAVEGARLSEAQIDTLMGPLAGCVREAPRSHLTLTRPAIGCFLSHLGIWRWVARTKLPQVAVLEDDAAPTAHLSPARLGRLLESAPAKNGLVFLGCLIMGRLAERPQGSELARLYYFNGTFAYVVTPATCEILLARMLPLRSHLDHQMSSVLIADRDVFPAYYADPPLFEPDWSLRSDCYVPLEDEPAADRELGGLIASTERLLMAEGRPLIERKA